MTRWLSRLLLIVPLACGEPAPPPAPPPSGASPSAAAGTDATGGSSDVGHPSRAGTPGKAYSPPAPPSPPIQLKTGGKLAVAASGGLVTSVEANASEVGAVVLRNGGNAVDAAVAVGFALAVTHPSAGNIGGGGFMIVRLKSGEVHAIDFREVAPAAATTKKMMAEIEAGAVGYASTAVPGTVAGLAYAAKTYGSQPLATLVQPSIVLAEKGHPLAARAATTLAWNWEKLKTDPEAKRIYGPTGKPMPVGTRFRQPDLAKTLKAIADGGPDGFYKGPVASNIADAMKKNGGDITLEDLAKYEVKERTPLSFKYRGFDVHTMPPPSMGGVALAELLMLLERADAYKAPALSALSLHLLAEASKRAYSERRLVGADPDFYPEDLVDDPVGVLLSEEHLRGRQPPIDPDHATPSDKLMHDEALVRKESPETTHFSVVDAEGNAVSCTVTQSAGFGAKVIIPKTGILMSNALGAFSEEGVNATEPGKRMASSMSPTILTRDGKLHLVVGSPGGDTIPNIVAQLISNMVDHQMTVDQAVLAPRIHHQWLPDSIRAEKQIPPSKEAQKGLTERGHKLELSPVPLGDGNIILFDPASKNAYGFADPREGGKAVGAAPLAR